MLKRFKRFRKIKPKGQAALLSTLNPPSSNPLKNLAGRQPALLQTPKNNLVSSWETYLFIYANSASQNLISLYSFSPCGKAAVEHPLHIKEGLLRNIRN
jgi:hypothetical protein